MKKRSIGLRSLMLLLLLFAGAAAAEDGINGFRNMKWGAPIASRKGMVRTESREATDDYRKTGEDLLVFGVKAREIIYTVVRKDGGLDEVAVVYGYHESTCRKLEGALKKLYGGHDVREGGSGEGFEALTWKKKNGSARLQCTWDVGDRKDIIVFFTAAGAE